MNNFRWTILAALFLTTAGVAHAQSPSPSASPMPLSSSSSSMSSSSSSMSSSSGATGTTPATAGGVADSGVINSMEIETNPVPPGPSGATPGIGNDKPVQELDGSSSTTTTTITTTVHSAGKHQASHAQAVKAGGTLVNTGGEPLLVSIIGLSMALSAFFVRRRVTD